MIQYVCITVIGVALIAAATAVQLTGGDASYAWGALGGVLGTAATLFGVQKTNGGVKP